MSGSPEIVATGLPFGEGPAMCADGSLVGTDMQSGKLWIVRPGKHAGEPLVDIGGSPNSVVIAADGGYVLAQNGGSDLIAMGLLTEGPQIRPARPGLQRVAPDGTVSYLTAEALQMPNDIVVAPDGTLFVTDHDRFPPDGEPRSNRIITFTPDGTWQVWADNFAFCNGIAQQLDGAIVVSEGSGLMRVHGPADDEREWITQNVGEGNGDGLAIDVEGNCYVAVLGDGGVRAFDPQGNELDFFAAPAAQPPLSLARIQSGGGFEGRAMVTDCIFAGDDMRTLLIFDALQGRILAWEGMPHPGVPVHAAPVQPTLTAE